MTEYGLIDPCASEPRTATALKKHPASRGHSILCVDDEPQILEAMALTLGRTYPVELAASGAAALEILRRLPATTVIISDMRMPSMDGAQFLAASRKITPEARRILLTGDADMATAIAAVNEGQIFRFLTKPCSFAKIAGAVEAAMADYDEAQREKSAMRWSVTRDVLSHDPLTGVASPMCLSERLELCTSRREEREWKAEVIFAFEVTDGADISDGFESKTGNEILRHLATRLQPHIPDAGCLARYREATFVALFVPEDSSDAGLHLLALNLISALEEPIDVNGVAVQIRVTIGIARIPGGTQDARVALHYAELAAREAKRPGHDSVRLFSHESIVKNERRRETIHALKLAVTNQELSLQYQPIIDLERNAVYSVEALARWEHSKLGFVPPGIFIPLAEETGLMVPLGEWVMNQACADGRQILSPLFPRVSVNVSVAQLVDSRFMFCLYQAMEKSGLPTSALELELTETVFAEDLDRVCKLLVEIRLLGVKVAIDDFGAGYSSLTYLNRLPIDVLKIDRAFVEDIDRGGEAIIGAAVTVAKALWIEVVIEGVETAAVLNRLRQLGATKFQGYYFARPMPVNSLGAWHAEFVGRTSALEASDAS